VYANASVYILFDFLIPNEDRSPNMLIPTEVIEDFHSNQHDARHVISRRDLLGGAIAIAGGVLVSHVRPAFAQEAPLPLTPKQTRGPFYPAGASGDMDADLTLIQGRAERAKGQIVYISGRVLDTRGNPVNGATLEVWQCNAAGKYAHPADTNKAPIDENFQGYALLKTDASGAYKIKTIKPGAYPTGSGDWSRPPHVHFDIKGRASRISTQMYFEGEALNAKDYLLNRIANKNTVVARNVALGADQEKDAVAVLWDIVLVSG